MAVARFQAGPYTGTFTETGGGTVVQPPLGIGTTTAFSASSTIYSPSGDVLVTGTKTLDTSVPNTTFVYLSPPRWAPARFQSIVGEVFSDPTGTALIEDFASSLLEPTPLLPTSKEQCKNGGWKTYGIFRNQGDCVSFVATGGKNPPNPK